MSDMPFTRKERAHLAVLHERLEHLKVNDPARSGNPEYRAGESNALAWALAVIEGMEEPVEIRVERLEVWRRHIESRLGRVEVWQREAEEEE